MLNWRSLSAGAVGALLAASPLLVANPAAAQEFKLGALATLSGPGASWGMAILSAA